MTPEQLDDRRKFLGASEIAAVVGQSPYQTPQDVWASKVKNIHQPDNPNMLRGRCLEGGLLDWYQALHPCEMMRQVRCVHPNGWAAATLDGLCTTPALQTHLVPAELQPPPRRWIVEIKCPTGGRQWDGRSGVYPFHYSLQVQWQLGVARASDITVLEGVLAAGPLWGKLAEFPLVFDEDLFEGLLGRATEFWEYVIRGEPLPASFGGTQETP